MRWGPNTTVASIIQNKNKFLMVEENTPDGIKINHPAGHLEKNETLLEATIRETLEETGYKYEPESIVGIYKWLNPKNNITYIRYTFTGSKFKKENQTLDENIIRPLWLTYNEIFLKRDIHRSPLVVISLVDYLKDKRFPLNIINELQ